MTPKTRAQTAAAASSRTYNSSPALRQVQFSKRRHHIVRTYGRRSLPATMRQQRLTQFYEFQAEGQGWMMDEEGGARHVEDEEEEFQRGDGRRKAVEVEERAGKRRRNTLGDMPSSASSSFHTQTLTQLLGQGVMAREAETREMCPAEDLEEKEEGFQGFEDLPVTAAPPVKRVQTNRMESWSLDHTVSRKEESKPPESTPLTPSNRTKTANLEEVPSSQPTPFTPFLGIKGPIGDENSPLEGRSTQSRTMLAASSAVVSPIQPRPSERSPDLVIHDTYSVATWSGSLRSDPLQTTPKVAIRRPLGEIVLSRVDLAAKTRSPRMSQRQRLKMTGAKEVPDSDEENATPTPRRGGKRGTPLRAVRSNVEEEEVEEDEEGGVVTPTPGPRIFGVFVDEREVMGNEVVGDGEKEEAAEEGDEPIRREVVKVLNNDDVDGEEEETHKEDGNANSEDDIGNGAKDAARSDNVKDHATPLYSLAKAPIIKRAPDENNILTEPPYALLDEITDESDDEVLCPSTPTPTARRVQILIPASSGTEVLKETPANSPKKTSPITQTETQKQTQAKSRHYSQGLESQRVPLEVIRAMDPQTDRSDIAVSIHPDIAAEIVKGVRDHEFRDYIFPATVSRIWIYVTHPVCELRYMCVIGKSKAPGQIPNDSGIGNREFNSGMHFKFAHKLVQIYQLNNPIALQRMKEQHWLKAPPARYDYLPPAIVGRLLSNLRCALFEEASLESDSTSLQEIQEKQRNDLVMESPKLRGTYKKGGLSKASQGWQTTAAAANFDSFVRAATPLERVGDSFVSPRVVKSRPSQSVRKTQTLHHLNPQTQTGNRSRRRNLRSQTASGSLIRLSQASTMSEPASSPSLAQSPQLPHLPQTALSQFIQRPTQPASDEASPSVVLARGRAMISSDSFANDISSDGLLLVDSSQFVLPESLLRDDVGPPPEGLESDEQEEEEEE